MIIELLEIKNISIEQNKNMKYIFKIILIISLIPSCTTNKNSSNTIVGEKCNSKLYDGKYSVKLERGCRNDPEYDYSFGRVQLDINQCNLSVVSLENAYFDTEQKVEDWKTLNGEIDIDGDVTGEMYLRTLYGKEKYTYLRFSGAMNDFKFKSFYQDCDFIFKLNKIDNAKGNTSLENEESTKPLTIIVPTGILGKIKETQKMILEKTLESKLDDYFSIVPKDLFEQAQEKAFEELEYEECTEEQCIVKIQELLQIENAFKLLLIRDNNDTQISLTWNNLDEKKVEEFYCENCNTKRLRESIEGIVDKLVSID